MTRNRFVIVRLIFFLGMVALPACEGKTPTITPQLTAVTLADGRIELQIVDLAQSMIKIPVHDLLLVRACDKISYENSNDDIACHIGVLDLEHGLFIRLTTLQGQQECASFLWSPDGQRFAYDTHNCYPYNAFLYGDISVFGADGSLEQPFWARDIRWSRDGHYLVVRTCEEPKMSYSYTEVVYNTTTWEDVCTFGAGHTFSACSVGVEGECDLSFLDGSTQVISTNDRASQVYSHCTNEEGDEVDCSTLWVYPIYDAYGTRSEAEHYRAFVEEHDLHIIDKQAGTEKVYTISDYYITSIAQAPE